VEYNTTGSTENAKIKGHYTRLDFGFDTYSALSFFFPSLAIAIWHRKPIITATIQKYLYLCAGFLLQYVSVYVCAYLQQKPHKRQNWTNATIPQRTISFQNTIPYNTTLIVNKLLTRKNRHSLLFVVFVSGCCFCCRRVFFHIQFHCMTYAFLPLMCLRSICINAWPFLFPHVTCMRMRALGLGWPKTNTQNSSIFDKPNYKHLRLVGLMQLTIWI